MRRHAYWIGHLALVLGVVLLVGCAPLGPAPLQEVSTAESAPATPAPTAENLRRSGPPVVGQPAPAFSAVDLNGNTVTLESLRGKKVLLNFWATWCPPCKAEVPLLVEHYPALQAAGYEIVAVSVMEDRGPVAAFAEREGMTFPVLIDPTGAVAISYYVQSIPVTYLLDEAGVVEDIHLGILTPSSLQARIEDVD